MFLSIVNDGLMTLFFLLIGLELKYHTVFGENTDKKTLILPSLAAIGGVVVPALIYSSFNYNTPTSKGWAIPIATDTAFMLGILSFFGKYISTKLRAFIISFSLMDDAIALLILALFYTKSSSIIALWISLALIILLLVLNFLKKNNVLYYLLIGAVLWIAMMKAGIHGTLSGAMLALIIPLRVNQNTINTSYKHLENILRPIVHYGILPLFVFINSGVKLENMKIINNCSNVSLGIILGLFLGKQLGVFCFSYYGIKCKWCKLPENTTLLKLYAISILGGIGFTLSLFIGGLTFEEGRPYYSMRSAVIIGSLLSAIIGTLVFKYSVRR